MGHEDLLGAQQAGDARAQDVGGVARRRTAEVGDQGDAADAALGTRQIQSPAGEIDLDGEWEWKPVYPTLSESVGEEITPDTDAGVLRRLADAHSVGHDAAWPAQKLVMELFGELPQHRGITINRAHRLAANVGQGWQPVISAEDVSGTIDEVEMLAVRHGNRLAAQRAGVTPCQNTS